MSMAVEQGFTLFRYRPRLYGVKMDVTQIGHPKENEKYPGFYHVPGKENAVIDRLGHVTFLKQNYCPFPYPHDGYWYYKGGSMHRMLALTFIPIPEELMNEPKLEVNHIDSDRANGSIENLEWVTRSGNSIHALISGKRTDNRPVLVKDVRDETVARFYSVHECGRRMGCSGAHVHYYLREKNRGKIYRRFFVFIYEGEKWPVIDSEMMGKTLQGSMADIVGHHLETGKVLIFQGVSSIERHLGIAPSAIRTAVRNKSGRIFNGWHFRERDDLTVVAPDSVIKRKTRGGRGNRKPIPVVVTNLLTGEATNWPSVELFARQFSAKKKTVQKSMGKKAGVWTNFRIEYLNG